MGVGFRLDDLARDGMLLLALVVALGLGLVQSALAQDAYEDDDVWAEAKWITTDGAKQTHTFAPLGDQDWMKFDAVNGTAYVIETFKVGGVSVDTVVDLYGPDDGDTHVAYNDDGGEGLCSLIVWTCSASGTYYVSVHEYGNSDLGTYDISVTTADNADAYEDDDMWEDANWITTDGAKQRHTFSPIGDQDWVRFDAITGRHYVVETFQVGDAQVDTVVVLYGPGEGTPQVGYDDDGGDVPFSRLGWLCAASGVYYARAHEFGDDEPGMYDLSVTEEAGPPDLTISDFSVTPSTSLLGTELALSVTVRNDGVATAGQHWVEAWRHRETPPVLGMCGEYYSTTGPLLPGEETNALTASFTPDHPGSRTAWVLVDSEDSVSEGNEDNNVASCAYEIGLRDLVISWLQVTPNPSTLGSELTLEVTEFNFGTEGAGEHSLAVWRHRTVEPSLPTHGDLQWRIMGLPAATGTTRSMTFTPRFPGPRTA